MKLFKYALTLALATAAVSFTSCNKHDEDDPMIDYSTGTGLFVVNEGNFTYSNASITFYDPATGETVNEAFRTANGVKLGDVAQSMAYDGKNAWIVVNGSHIIYAINPVTFKETGRMEDMGSPRYLEFISPDKAYLTQLYDNRIWIIDPSKYIITGYVDVPGMDVATGSTECMVRDGKYVYCTCWSYNTSIIKIDTTTDKVVASVEVGIQPQSLVIDANGTLWTITDGGWEGNPLGYEEPALVAIDASTMKVTRTLKFELGSMPSKLCIDHQGKNLLWLNGSVYKMGISDSALPAAPFISTTSWLYGLTVNPVNGDIYTSDAIDYMQPGVVYRYNAAGQEVAKFRAGIIPGSFCWK